MDSTVLAQQTNRTTPAPWVHSKTRTGQSPVERKALGNLQRNLHAMSASLLVQIALWPLTIAEIARMEKVSSSMLYNCLAGTKPYGPARNIFARYLGVTRAAIDHIIDADPGQPPSQLPPDPIEELLVPAVSQVNNVVAMTVDPDPGRFEQVEATSKRRRRVSKHQSTDSAQMALPISLEGPLL